MQEGAEPLALMADACTSCGECVRPCSFLRQQGPPAQIAQRGIERKNLLSAYGCSLCGLCDALCPEGLSPSAMFLAMRQKAAAQGLVELRPYRSWLNYEKLGSHPLFQRDSIPVGCRTVFFPGCSLSGSRPDAVRGLYRLLQQHDPAVGLVLDCCGKISHDLGLVDRFEGIFSRLAQRLHARGIVRVLTTCPGCSKVFRNHAKAFEVTSVYELLTQAGRAVPQQGTDAGGLPAVSIHDPCPSRFDAAQQQAVRQLAVSCGYRVEELPDSRRYTRCCGQGGMVEGCVPGVVKKEAALIGAEAAGRPLLSSCGACCETLGRVTSTAHIADLLTGTGTFSTKPVSSRMRWINRLKLAFLRLS